MNEDEILSYFVYELFVDKKVYLEFLHVDGFSRGMFISG
jgi:hypothetical protein